jgi:hypothetical protein
VVGGVIAIVGLVYGNTGDKLQRARPGPAQGPVVVPRTVHRSIGSVDQIRDVAAHFIETAVYRRHLDDAYDLAAPVLRAGMSRREWRTGNIPVVPFPASQVAEIKWTLDYSFPRRLGMKVALISKPNAPETGLVAHMELMSVGRGAHRRWLVDSWVPMGGGQALQRAISPLGQATGKSPSPQLSAAWLLVPIGLICGLILMVPIGLGVRGWVRHSRATRAYSSSSRPS